MAASFENEVAMTCYFAFQASDALRDSSLALMENFERGVAEPQSAAFVKVAQLFSDEIVNALLLNIVRAEEAKHSGAKALEQFAKIVTDTVHYLIRQVLGKMSNDDLRPLAGYIKERRLTQTVDGKTRDLIVFPMQADFHARFRAVLEKCAAGEQHPEELLACMEHYSELSVVAFYDDSLNLVKLGFLGRKMVSVGSVAIRKGSQAATRRLIPPMSGDELVKFSKYFLSMLITV
jgi:hypothetical protein